MAGALPAQQHLIARDQIVSERTLHLIGQLEGVFLQRGPQISGHFAALAGVFVHLGFVIANPPAKLTLGSIHRHICIVEQPGPVSAVFGVDCDANAAAGLKRGVVHQNLAIERSLQTGEKLA